MVQIRDTGRHPCQQTSRGDGVHFVPVEKDEIIGRDDCSKLN